MQAPKATGSCLECGSMVGFAPVAEACPANAAPKAPGPWEQGVRPRPWKAWPLSDGPGSRSVIMRDMLLT
jgi:hypothetical protein